MAQENGLEQDQFVKVFIYIFINPYVNSQANVTLAITCLDLPIPDNGVIIYESSAPYRYGISARYNCNPGFGLDGGDTFVRCGGNGSSPMGMWTGNTPTCQGTSFQYTMITHYYSRSDNMPSIE